MRYRFSDVDVWGCPDNILRGKALLKSFLQIQIIEENDCNVFILTNIEK